MKRVTRIVSVYASIVLSLALVSSPLQAVQCPGPDGAQIELCIDNPTSTAKTITFSGNAVTGRNTCTTALSSFSNEQRVAAANSNQCYVMAAELLPDNTGATNDLLQTGLWQITATYSTTVNNGTANVSLTQRVPVVYNNDSPTPKRTRLNWTYFPQVYNVAATGDGAISACTSNCSSNCTLRHALKCANDASSATSKPVLVRFTLTDPTEIDMSNTAALTVAGAGKITIDGTNATGRPWVVGDFKAPQDSFSWTIDLNNSTNFVVTSSNNTIQGLEIKNTHSAGTSQAKHLIDVQSGINNLVKSVRLDGGNDCNSGQCTTSTSFDLIHVASGNGFGTPGLTARNVEGRGARDQGAEVTDLGYALVKDSWMRNNLSGGLRAAIKGKLRAERNVVELSGRGMGKTGAPFGNADGLSSIGDVGGTTELESDANLVRLNSNNGLTIKNQTNPKLKAFNDYTCGNSFQGVGVALPSIVTGQGLAAVYNLNRGVNVGSGSSGTMDFGGGDCSDGLCSTGSNAFARNQTNCDFTNDSTLAIKAESSQWGPDGNPLLCGSGSALIDTTPTQPFATVDVVLDSANPSIPSNVFLRDQTVRVRGTGFNAVNANPAPSNCVIGNPNPPYSEITMPCCNTLPPATNVCDSGTHNPFDNGSQCVEFKDGQGIWRPANQVAGVTPTTIVVGVPAGNGGGIPCIGGVGEVIHVSKVNTENAEVLDDGRPWCNNTAQKDLF